MTTHKNIQLYFYITLLVIIFLFNLAVFSPFIKLFVISAIFAVIFYPIYTKINRKLLKNKSLAATSTIFIIIIIVLVPITFFTTQVFLESKDLYTNISSLDNSMTNISNAVNNKIGFIMPEAKVDISSHVSSIFSNLTSSIGSIFSGVLNFITILFLALFILFFFIRDGATFIHKIIKVSPLEDAHDQKILSKLKDTINSIIKGSLVIACLQGILTWFGLLIFGVPSPALWGGLAVFSSLIPGIGTALVIGPAIVYLFYTSTLFNAVGLLIWGTVIVGLVDNFIRPYLVGKDVNIHPLIILISIFGGLLMFGAFGFLFGPLLLSFFSVLIELYPTITKKVID